MEELLNHIPRTLFSLPCSWLTYCVGWAEGCWPDRTAPPHSSQGRGASTGTRPTLGDSSHHQHHHLQHLQHLQHTVCDWQCDHHWGGSPCSLSGCWKNLPIISSSLPPWYLLHLKSHPLTNFLFIAAQLYSACSRFTCNSISGYFLMRKYPYSLIYLSVQTSTLTYNSETYKKRRIKRMKLSLKCSLQIIDYFHWLGLHVDP